MIEHYWAAFSELVVVPFKHVSLVWGIVPLYFGLLLNELTSDKANFRTAVQTGFSFLWAGAQWLWPYFSHQMEMPQIRLATLPVNLLVTFLTIALGVVALISGIRRKYPEHLHFIGHTRFANYLMITSFQFNRITCRGLGTVWRPSRCLPCPSGWCCILA